MDQQPNVLNFTLGSAREPAERSPVVDGTPSPSIDMLKDVPLRVTVELGRARLFIRDVLALRNGSVVELDRPAGGAVDLLVNGVLIARGEVVVVDERFGIRISEVVASLPSAKINAL